MGRVYLIIKDSETGLAKKYTFSKGCACFEHAYEMLDKLVADGHLKKVFKVSDCGEMYLEYKVAKNKELIVDADDTTFDFIFDSLSERDTRGKLYYVTK